MILPLYLSAVFGDKVEPELRLGDLRLDPDVTNAAAAYAGAYLHWALLLHKPGPS